MNKLLDNFLNNPSQAAPCPECGHDMGLRHHPAQRTAVVSCEPCGLEESAPWGDMPGIRGPLDGRFAAERKLRARWIREHVVDRWIRAHVVDRR